MMSPRLMKLKTLPRAFAAASASGDELVAAALPEDWPGVALLPPLSQPTKKSAEVIDDARIAASASRRDRVRVIAGTSKFDRANSARDGARAGWSAGRSRRRLETLDPELS